MKPLLLTAIALLTGLALAGCRSPAPTPAADPEANLTQDGLRPLVRSGFARAWVRPGTSFAEYDRFRARYEEISYRRPPGSDRGMLGGIGGDNFALPAGVKRSLEESLRTIFQTEITRGAEWRTVDANGAGVLLVRVALGDLFVHAPIGTLGGDDLMWIDSLGEVTLLVELYDSETKELIGRLLERRAWTTGVNRPIRATVGAATYEAHRIFRAWAKRLRSLLDAMKDVDPAAS